MARERFLDVEPDRCSRCFTLVCSLLFRNVSAKRLCQGRFGKSVSVISRFGVSHGLPVWKTGGRNRPSATKSTAPLAPKRAHGGVVRNELPEPA